MPLGWIDFSKTERNKVLSVLDLLSESGTLDELGISPVRDGFANLFFPGTSTIQTRAKYFMIVPYALKDLEYSTETNPNRLLRMFDEIERRCAEQLVRAKDDTDGIIGKVSLAQNKWVKRTPADIYWAGLRYYGIFIGGNLSLSEYMRAMCALKNQKETLMKLGSRNDAAETDERDDKDAGELFKMQFWRIPTYSTDWNQNLSIKLTREEGAFLKGRILASYPDSMMAHILRNNYTEALKSKTFQELVSLIGAFPQQVQDDYALAYGFSEFLYVLRTLYNVIVSAGQNEDANSEWANLEPILSARADIDLDRIFSRLQIYGNADLCSFLRKSQSIMKDGNVDSLKAEIKRRERYLKDSRAKTMHPGEFDPKAWFGGGQLDYRFGNAKVILSDIFESEGTLC